MIGAGDTRRYRAFISYSHRDEVAAAALHRRLERYRLPRRLAGAAGRLGLVPARLTPVFRDQEELSAADSLSEAVETALRNSESLVVLCSRHAAASVWVAKEIVRFRELHPDRPILAVLLSGPPAAAFPAPLTAGGLEPLAADLTGGGGGRQLGFLKLVAGIAGVDLDALVQRDAQRRLRRVMAITGATFILALLMMAMMFIALNARAEADRRRQEAQAERAQAEGLVDFMLTDLRERLKAAGRTDVLEAANRRALTYFAGQDLARMPAGRLQRRAAGLHNLAEDEITKKHWDHAAAAAAEAVRTTALLLAAAPDDPERVYGHAQSVYWQAAVPNARAKFAAAEPGFIAYDRLTRRLLALRPAALRSTEEAAFGAGNLCDVRMWQKKRDGLMATCRRSLALMEVVAARRPADLATQLNLTNRIAWAADGAHVMGDYAGSRRLRERQGRLLRTLARRHPDDARIPRELAIVDRALASIAARLGDRAAARHHQQRAIAGEAAAAAADPANRVIADRLRDMKTELEGYQ